MSFETSAELSLTVDEGDLRNVRQQIEDGIGTTAVGVADGGSMSAQSAGGSGGGRGRQARRSMRLAESRNEYLEDVVIYLEEIEDKVGGGGGGGAGGVFTEILGVAGETAGDAAIEAGDTVAEAITQVLTGTAATALGNTISSAITNSEVAVEDTTLTVKRPGWLDEFTSRSYEFKPTVKPTFDAPDVDLGPDLNLGVPDTIAVDRDPLPVQRDPLPVDREPLLVEDVGPITVNVRTGEVGPVSRGNNGSSNYGPLSWIPGNKRIVDGVRGVTPDFITERIDSLPGAVNNNNSADRPTGGGSVSVSVTHNPTYRVDVDPRKLNRLADRIVSDIEDNVERDIDELEQEIDQLRSNLGNLEREIRN